VAACPFFYCKVIAMRQGRRSRTEVNTRPIPIRHPRRMVLNSIDDKGAAAIHAGVKRILWDTGMQVADPEARALLIAAGCRDLNGRLHYPPDLIDKTIETIPRRITFFNQDGDRVFATDDAIPRFGTAVNCVQVLDPHSGAYRPCLLSDIGDHGRLQEGLRHIDIAASLGYPSDVPPEEESLLSARALLDTTRKPIFFTGHDEHIVKKIWDEMGGRVGGMGNLAAKPIGLDLIGPLSPLKLSGETCQRLIMAARLMLPVVCYPAIFPGLACPLTLAGAIAQAAAESLAGIVISQLVQPGAPVMSGSSVMPMDMRRADMAIGSPEYTLAGLGAADYFTYIGVPSWVGSGCTDAHNIGPQALSEVAASLQGTALASCALTHNLGVLSSGRTGSMEMLVLCDELAGMTTRFAAGIEVSEETIASDVVHRASADNSFLTDPHTLARYETGMWMPTLFRRESLEDWQEDAQELPDRLRDRLSSILNGS
jgi:trimethylamine--corrinoid protein Co-methyltransferase